MKKKLVHSFFAMMVMAFMFGTALNPVMTQVFAAEQTEGQDDQTPPPANTTEQTQPSDHSETGTDEHAGHHQM